MSQDINKVECTEKITKDCYCYVCTGGKFRRVKVSDLLALVETGKVTVEAIEAALGYAPAKEDTVQKLSEQKVDKPTGNGTAGQALLTNGDGTTYWEYVGGGSGGGITVTDDGDGNVVITSTGSVSITDDGNGNVVIA